ncbi:MAG: NAD(+)/NADH kinase [Candidatus Anammoxibacter sp.]
MKNEKILILGNLSKEKVNNTVVTLKPWLEERVKIVEVVDIANEVECKELENVGADIGIVLGGDGAILSACRRLGKNQIPLVGVHLGNFGFLTELTLNEVHQSLEKILAGEYRLASRVLLFCRVLRGNKVVKESIGVNDVVISRPSLSRLIVIQIKIDGEDIANYRSDGIIVSTPIGSTAHNLAAGGPILAPELSAFILTPICPHTLTNRPLVIPSTAKIELRELSAYPGIGLTIDGQVYVELAKGDVVSIEKSNIQLQLIDTRTRTFYSVLHDKLNWADHPKYAKN